SITDSRVLHGRSLPHQIGSFSVLQWNVRWYRTTIRAAYSDVGGTKIWRSNAMMPCRGSLLIFLTTCLVTGSLLAGPTATLTGRVTDPSGGVIAGVKV